MKGFAGLPSRKVTLTREDGATIELDLTPTPPGFSELVDRHMPPPYLFVNGQPSDTMDPKLAPEHMLRKNLVLLGKSLGDQMETPWPKELSTKNLEAYAKSLLDEFTNANLVIGDMNALIRELGVLNRGGGKPPKAG